MSGSDETAAQRRKREMTALRAAMMRNPGRRFSVRETADITGMSPANVHRVEQRALAKIGRWVLDKLGGEV